MVGSGSCWRPLPATAARPWPSWPTRPPSPATSPPAPASGTDRGRVSGAHRPVGLVIRVPPSPPIDLRSSQRRRRNAASPLASRKSRKGGRARPTARENGGRARGPHAPDVQQGSTPSPGAGGRAGGGGGSFSAGRRRANQEDGGRTAGASASLSRTRSTTSSKSSGGRTTQPAPTRQEMDDAMGQASSLGSAPQVTQSAQFGASTISGSEANTSMGSSSRGGFDMGVEICLRKLPSLFLPRLTRQKSLNALRWPGRARAVRLGGRYAGLIRRLCSLFPGLCTRGGPECGRHARQSPQLPPRSLEPRASVLRAAARESTDFPRNHT